MDRGSYKRIMTKTMNQQMKVCAFSAANACSFPRASSQCNCCNSSCVRIVPPDIRDYCKIIGLDPEKEKSLVHIAVEALKAPLPRDWKPM